MSVDQEMLTLVQSAGFAFAVVVNHEIVGRKRAPELTLRQVNDFLRRQFVPRRRAPLLAAFLSPEVELVAAPAGLLSSH